MDDLYLAIDKFFYLFYFCFKLHGYAIRIINIKIAALRIRLLNFYGLYPLSHVY